MKYYQQCVRSLKSTIAFTTTLWWIVLCVVLVIVFMRLPLYLVVPCIAFMLLYSTYLWYYADNVNPTHCNYIDWDDQNDVTTVRQSCEAFEHKWRAIGSPAHITSSLDLIQLLYSLRDWCNTSPETFDHLVDLVDFAVMHQSALNVEKVLRYFQEHFSSCPKYTELYDSLLRLLTPPDQT